MQIQTNGYSTVVTVPHGAEREIDAIGWALSQYAERQEDEKGQYLRQLGGEILAKCRENPGGVFEDQEAQVIMDALRGFVPQPNVLLGIAEIGRNLQRKVAKADSERQHAHSLRS